MPSRRAPVARSVEGSAMDALSLISREPLDETSDVPLYRQLRHRILQAIAMGALEEGTPLPTEQALCDTFGLSRATVRRCFKDLVDEGYATRRRGRGSFVSLPGKADGLDTLYTQVSTSSSITRSGATPGSRLIRVREIAAEKAVAKRLNLRAGTRVWEVNRLRLANGDPILHEVAYVPRALCPHLGQEDFDRSIYLYIAEASGSLAVSTDEVIEVVALDRHEARLLGAAPGSPAARIIATSYDTQGTPIETSVGIARADRFRVVARYGTEGARLRKDIG